jgi:SAM-dependent methyltransferase
MSEHPKAEAWSLVASAYTRELGPHVGRYARDALNLLELPAHSKVLDVAAGSGAFSLLAAAEGHDVTAVDFSPLMLDLLAERALREGLTVTRCVADGHDLPYADGSFDVVVSVFGLIFFDDVPRGLRELRRVTAGQGRALVTSWVPLESVPEFAAFFDVLRRLLPALTIPPVPAPLGTPEEMRAGLLAGGFGRVQLRAVAHDLEYASAREFWQRFSESAAPLALLRRRVGAEHWADLSSTAIAELTSALGRGTIRARMTSHFGLAWA